MINEALLQCHLLCATPSPVALFSPLVCLQGPQVLGTGPGQWPCLYSLGLGREEGWEGRGADCSGQAKAVELISHSWKCCRTLLVITGNLVVRAREGLGFKHLSWVLRLSSVPEALS